MAAIPQINIIAPKRVPFDDTIPVTVLDYTGATPLMEIRAEPGDQGGALVSLGASSSGSEGIAITYEAGYLDPDTGDVVGASIVRIIINETTLEGLAYGADPSQSVTLYYDLHLAPSGGKKFILCAGAFIIMPGVTL
ncbi:hypothetical protein [Allopontixanthobacter sediminis]|uniref:Uncharacterized protein n=1 Tax=Allopontixanthobacter sediminis TaxID=1689985 RepID=A0A845B0P7_9SPHN|nr:hypothetical protein [Allopontixanthobacter sediminis]MXP42997.1 hypothetical protein [Allopontixanthobacter sediminis]